MDLMVSWAIWNIYLRQRDQLSSVLQRELGRWAIKCCHLFLACMLKHYEVSCIKPTCKASSFFFFWWSWKVLQKGVLAIIILLFRIICWSANWELNIYVKFFHVGTGMVVSCSLKHAIIYLFYEVEQSALKIFRCKIDVVLCWKNLQDFCASLCCFWMQNFLQKTNATDASGNIILGDIGVHIQQEVGDPFLCHFWFL